MRIYVAIAACLLLLIVAIQADGMMPMLGSAAVSSGGSYGGASMPALPCPKNYLFSCQPSMSPAPCSQASYGSTGAYSDNYPVYAVPVAQYVNGFQVY